MLKVYSSLLAQVLLIKCQGINFRWYVFIRKASICLGCFLLGRSIQRPNFKLEGSLMNIFQIEQEKLDSPK